MATLTDKQIVKYKQIHKDSSERFDKLFQSLEDGEIKNAFCHAKHLRGNLAMALNIINKAEGKG